MKYRLFCFALAAIALVATGSRGSAQQEEFPFQLLDRYLKPLIQQIGMPGLSAVILQGGRVAWKGEYGYADAEKKIPLTIDTPMPVGGITQAVTGVLVGVCIDRYGFEIDQDIRNIVPSFPVSETRIRQVLAHATGGRFQYNPSYYSSLTQVVESPRCANPSYRQAMAVEVLDRLAMVRSVPGMDINRPEGAAARDQFSAAAWSRYQSVLTDLAVPYRIDDKGRSSRSDYSSYGLDASSGLVSTASDLAKFEGELDKRNGVPLSFSTLDQMWSNTVFNFGSFSLTTPTGLGWFVTNESGARVVWTFGHIPDVSSALIVKLPSKQLTLIMLANSGGLAQGYDLENANVTSSPFVKIFLRLFI
ncbi:MAG TPA: serine hydrolase domain-containing protein [Vicinamibacterales bacterium]|nr:serine hydrolase domain-containing protein [Vicinamibacterales bacterium]